MTRLRRARSHRAASTQTSCHCTPTFAQHSRNTHLRDCAVVRPPRPTIVTASSIPFATKVLASHDSWTTRASRWSICQSQVPHTRSCLSPEKYSCRAMFSTASPRRCVRPLTSQTASPDFDENKKCGPGREMSPSCAIWSITVPTIRRSPTPSRSRPTRSSQSRRRVVGKRTPVAGLRRECGEGTVALTCHDAA